jgi:hypothetical protein
VRAPDGQVLFGKWMPDIPALLNPGLTEALNVLPVDRTYKPYRPIAGTGDALAARPRGALALFDASGNALLYVGTATKLYVKSGSGWTDKSGATTFTTGDQDYWRFSAFDSTVIATNYADVPVAITTGSGGNFATLALTGTAPNARQIGVIGRFVVLGDTDDAAGVIPHAIRWPAIDDPTDWPTPGSADALSKQAGRQILNSAYGSVRSISGGEQFGVVLQRTAVTRMTYVGGNLVFQFDTIDRSRGALFANATVQEGDRTYFIGSDGFYVTNGVNVEPIADGEFARHFLDTVDTNHIERVYGALDKPNRLIYWIYPGPGNTSGRPNRIIAYNYMEKRATRATDEIELLATGLTTAISLDDLDALFASIDDVTPSLDSYVWQGGSDLLTGFDADFKRGEFSGTPGTAVIDGQEVELNPGRYTRIQGVKSLVVGTSPTVTVALGSRNSLGEAVTYSDAVSPTASTGFSDFDEDESRYVRARTNITGDFDSALGVQYQAKPGGAG